MAGPSTRRYIVEKIASLRAQHEKIAADLAAFERVLAVMDADAAAEVDLGGPKTVPNAILQLLQETGKPLHYTMILEQLQRRGVVVRGQDPSKNVGAHMSGDPRFVSNGQGFWGLKSWGGNPPNHTTAPMEASERRVVQLGTGRVPSKDEIASLIDTSTTDTDWQEWAESQTQDRNPSAG